MEKKTKLLQLNEKIASAARNYEVESLLCVSKNRGFQHVRNGFLEEKNTCFRMWRISRFKSKRGGMSIPAEGTHAQRFWGRRIHSVLEEQRSQASVAGAVCIGTWRKVSNGGKKGRSRWTGGPDGWKRLPGKCWVNSLESEQFGGWRSGCLPSCFWGRMTKYQGMTARGVAELEWRGRSLGTKRSGNWEAVTSYPCVCGRSPTCCVGRLWVK